MGKFIDLTGQTINGIFIESYATNVNKSRPHWNAICFCGNRFVVDGKHLRAGRIKSCGCISGQLKANAKQTIKPWMIFGDYIVESFDHRNDYGIYFWNCRCTTCGDQRVISKIHLRDDKPIKCKKHVKKEVPDIIGNTYDFLFVDSLSDTETKDGKPVWNCTCLLCGKSTQKTLHQLLSGKSKSCGCLRGKVSGERVKLDIAGEIFNDIYVVREHGKDKRNNIIWECTCLRCNNTFYDIASSIKSGYRKNCGCTRLENIRRVKFNDLSGKVINNIFVESFAGYGTDGRVMWNCVCKECSNKFVVPAHSLVSGKRVSCGCQKSSGEYIIRNILEKYNIKYVSQKTFIGCVSKAKLKFDFWLPEYGACIEYDGEQHYGVVRNWDDNEERFLLRKEHDSIKDRWCHDNDVILFRISYKDKNRLEEVVKDLLFLNDTEEVNSSDIGLSA